MGGAPKVVRVEIPLRALESGRFTEASIEKFAVSLNAPHRFYDCTRHVIVFEWVDSPFGDRVDWVE